MIHLVPDHPNKNKTALVIPGGGAKGAYSLGAIDALLEKGVKFDAVYGTSVGALHAYGLKYCGIEAMKRAWFSIKSREDILNFHFFPTLFLSGKGIYSLSPLSKLIGKYSVVTNESLEAVISTVSLITGKLHYYYASQVDKKSFMKWALASSAIPGVMDPIGDEWVDGGVREIAPLKQALKDGYGKIILIEHKVPDFIPTFKLGNYIDNLYRAIDGIMLSEIYENDLQYCAKHATVYRISPSRQMLGTFDFKRDKIKAGFEEGYTDVINKQNIV